MSYEELRALVDVLLRHVESLDRSERSVKDASSYAAMMSVVTFKAWKASLLRLANKAREVYEEARGGNRLAASIDACELSDQVRGLIMAASVDDPIFLSLRPTLSYLQAVASVLCRPLPQPTTQP